MANQVVDAARQWWTWLVERAPLPDRRSRAILGGGLAALAVVAVGLPLVFGGATKVPPNPAAAAQPSGPLRAPPPATAPVGPGASTTTSTTTSTPKIAPSTTVARQTTRTTIAGAAHSHRKRAGVKTTKATRRRRHTT